MKPKILVITIYICAGAAIASSLCVALALDVLGAPSLRVLFQGLVVFGPPLAFVMAYARWLLEPGPGRSRRLVAAIVNGSALTALITYLLLVPNPVNLVPEDSIAVPLVFEVIVPLVFVVASVAIFRKDKHSYITGTIAALLAWPYFACMAFAPSYFRHDLNGLLSSMYQFACFISPLIYFFASVALFYLPRFGYILGSVGGLTATPWFVTAELSGLYGDNSWIALNSNWPGGRNDVFILLAELRILAVALIVVATVCSLSRLLPARWTFRKRPLRDRTWPAFAVCFVILTVWFGRSATPYRIPGIVDAPSPELAVLHVEKLGLQFHEMAISAYRDSRFYISRNDRRLFQYRFEESVAEGVLPKAICQHVFSLVQLPLLNRLRTQPPKVLRAWNAEGWYIRSPRSGLLAFTSEYGTAPPKELVELFHEMHAVVRTDKGRRYSMKDVCLGFCYDPLAGLGIRFENQRCRTDEKGRTRCW
jgi:hypothetical protein